MSKKEPKLTLPANEDAELDRLSGHLQEMVDEFGDQPLSAEEESLRDLIYEGLERLESGDTFDVDKDLADLMDLQRKRLRSRENIKLAAIGSEIITTAAFIIVLFVVLFYQ